MEEPNFKVHTDFDTPSGDASLLRGQEHPSGVGLLDSTEISSQPVQLDQPSQTGQPSLPSISIDGSASQTSSAGGKSGVACDLCDQMVKSEGYLAQHRNKKKCIERQRVKKQYQEQLEASVDRMESLRVSESDTSDAGNSSKV